MGITYSQVKQLLKKYPSKQYSDTSFYGIVFDNKKNKVKKNWKHSASVDLKGKADKINIRDLAYE